MCIHVYTHTEIQTHTETLSLRLSLPLPLSRTHAHTHTNTHTREREQVRVRDRTSARTCRSWSVTRRSCHVQLGGGGGGDAILKETAVLQQLACVDGRARRRINLKRQELVSEEMTKRRRVQHQPHTHILRASHVSGAVDTNPYLDTILGEARSRRSAPV